jgi:hypothetical protein
MGRFGSARAAVVATLACAVLAGDYVRFIGVRGVHTYAWAIYR